MTKMTRIFAVVTLILLIGTVASAEDEKKMKETYYANAFALGRGLASELQVTITRWTTDEERETLLKTLVEEGQEAMIKILGKQDETGFLRLPNTMGYRLYYAHLIQDGANRKIVLATDRPVSMAEAWRDGRSMDYAITLVELQLDESNKGEGTLLFAAKLKVDQEKKTIGIENYGTDPVQLRNVREKD